MLVRLKPSKNVEPSITATIAIVPGVGSLRESPENGVRDDELAVLAAAERS